MVAGPSSIKRRIAPALFVLVALGAALLSGFLAGSGRSRTHDPGVIAFTRADGIYVMRADGSGVRPLRRGGPAAGVVGLDWSPDGRRLAFVNMRSELWAMNADGGALVRLAVRGRKEGDFLYSVSWSTDGRSIAYTAKRDSTRDVWLWTPTAPTSGRS